MDESVHRGEIPPWEPEIQNLSSSSSGSRLYQLVARVTEKKNIDHIQVSPDGFLALLSVSFFPLYSKNARVHLNISTVVVHVCT